MGKFIILHGPQGCGKTRWAERIAKHLGCDKIVDDWEGVIDQKHVAPLYIVTDGDRSLAVARELQIFEIVSFAEVAQQINAAIPKTCWMHCDEQPARPGVYQTDHDSGAKQPGYSHWDGSKWGCERTAPNDAIENAKYDWAAQAKGWRGLAEEPIGVT